MNQHLLAKGGQVEHLIDLFTIVSGNPRGFTIRAAGICAQAECQPASDTEFAGSAKCAETGNDMVARFHRAHFAAHGAHDTRSLVSGNCGQGMGVRTIYKMQVRMAKTTGLGVD